MSATSIAGVTGEGGTSSDAQATPVHIHIFGSDVKTPSQLQSTNLPSAGSSVRLEPTAGGFGASTIWRHVPLSRRHVVSTVPEDGDWQHPIARSDRVTGSNPIPLTKAAFGKLLL